VFVLRQNFKGCIHFGKIANFYKNSLNNLLVNVCVQTDKETRKNEQACFETFSYECAKRGSKE
jgi:hypothetical protein